MTHIEIKDRHGTLIRVRDAEQSEEIASVWMFVLHEGDKSCTAEPLDQKHASSLAAALDRFAYDADTQPLVHEARISRVAWHKASKKLPPHGHPVLVVGDDSTVWMGTYLEKWGELYGDYSDNPSWCDYNEEEDEYYFPEGWYGVGPYDGVANGFYQQVDTPVAYWRELPLPPPF